MIADPAAPPFWAREPTAWDRDRDALAKLRRARERLFAASYEAEARRIYHEVRQLERQLGLTPTVYPGAGAPGEFSGDNARSLITGYAALRRAGLCVDCAAPSDGACRCPSCAEALAQRRAGAV